MDSYAMYGIMVAATALTCFVRTKTSIQNVNRDLWSLMCRLCSVAWFSSILYRSVANCGENGWQNKLQDHSDPFSIVVKGLGRDDCMPFDLQIFPIAQIIYYASELAWLSTRPSVILRKDDQVMKIHHTITIFLIGYWGVYHQGYWLSTLLPTLHDISDLFIDSAKYFSKHPRIPAFFIDFCFFLFVVSWVFARVYYIPFRFLPALWNDPDGPHVVHAYYGFSLLVLLQFAQAYWTVLLGKAVYRAVTSGKLSDNR